jgi:hypothetical protein
MIQQKVGDLLEIQYEGKYYYVVVLTKIVMFGGNTVFAHHTDGGRKETCRASIEVDAGVPRSNGQWLLFL